jgi:hypothetical protein
VDRWTPVSTWAWSYAYSPVAIRKRLPGPSSAEGGDAFFDQSASVRRSTVKHFEFARPVTPTYKQLKPSLGDEVDDCSIFGDPKRIV